MSSSPDAQAERQIVDAARDGDEGALSELYAIYFPRIYRYILARTGDVSDAEDLTEEVFLRVVDAIGRFEWREAPFSAWIFRIAHNAVISHRRRNGARPRSTPLTEALPINIAGPEEQVEKELLLQEVIKAAKMLPETQQRVIELRFLAGLTVAETAKALGKGEGNVKVIQHKAIARLKDVLSEKPKIYGKKKH